MEKKASALPGYKGFVPGVKSDGLYGKSVAEQSRDVLTVKKLDSCTSPIATTG